VRFLFTLTAHGSVRRRIGDRSTLPASVSIKSPSDKRIDGNLQRRFLSSSNETPDVEKRRNIEPFRLGYTDI